MQRLRKVYDSAVTNLKRCRIGGRDRVSTGSFGAIQQPTFCKVVQIRGVKHTPLATEGQRRCHKARSLPELMKHALGQEMLSGSL